MTKAHDFFIPGKVGRLSVRTKGMDTKPINVVVMIHGSNLTGQTMFDFDFPATETYSVMDALVGRGWGAVTFSIRGYGLSDAPADPFSVDTDAGMEDLGSVLEWLASQGWARPHILAFSWGGRIAGRFAEDNGDAIDRLILYDAARGGGNPVLPAPGPDEGWWLNTYETYLGKLEADWTDPELLKALGRHLVAHEPRAPNGVRRENAGAVTAVNPAKVTRPTMMIYGIEAAKANYMQGGLDRGAFFEQLATDDKSFVLLPDGGDFIHWQKGRRRFHDAVHEFLIAGGASTR